MRTLPTFQLLLKNSVCSCHQSSHGPLAMPPLPICFHVEPQWQPHGGTLAHAASANPMALDSKCITSLSLGLGVFDLSGVLAPLSEKHSFLVSNSVLTDQGQTHHRTPHPPSPLRHSLGGHMSFLHRKRGQMGAHMPRPSFWHTAVITIPSGYHAARATPSRRQKMEKS